MTIPLDLGDLLDQDAEVTANVDDEGRWEILRVELRFGETLVATDVAADLNDIAREYIIQIFADEHADPTVEPEDIPGGDR